MKIKIKRNFKTFIDRFKSPSERPYNLRIFLRLVICFLLLSFAPMIIFWHYIKEIDSIRFPYIIVCACLIVLAVLVSMILSESITNPIRYLLSLMKRVGAGDISAESVITGKNEIAGLSEGFNSMIANIRKLRLQNEKAFNELESAYKAISEANDENYILAFTDALTGLPNRRAYIEEMNKLLSEYEGEGFIALLYIDIDDFKKINDSVGHATGDHVLIEIKERLFSITSGEDCFIARLSGDEFLIILRSMQQLADIEKTVLMILNSFKTPFVAEGKEYYLSSSIGVAIAPDDATNSLDLMTNADAAMFKAKTLGKNMFTFFNVAVREQAIKDMKIEGELRRAIADKNFELYYQPQINLEANRICGFEALIRWNDPQNGIRMPGEFIGVAERTGLIVQIGEWVVNQACRQAKEWSDKGYEGYTVAVNLSARQFRDKEIFGVISGALKDTGLDPKLLDLELTESIAIDNIDYTLETMNEIKRLGIAFSLDDFGTGYSSMNYLKHLPFDNLKIDKSYIDNIADNVSEQEIIKAVIALAHALDMKVISEGIESQEQSDIISRFNCDIGQGYLYGRPLKAVDAEKMLQA